MAALERHIEEVQAHPLLRGLDIDFKLQASSKDPSPGVLQHETKFDTLAIKLCEVRTLGGGGNPRRKKVRGPDVAAATPTPTPNAEPRACAPTLPPRVARCSRPWRRSW